MIDPLRNFMCEKARVGTSERVRFQRMNIACPRPILNEALRRIEEAVKERRI